MLPITAGKPNPPNIEDEGMAGPELGFFMVYLANAIAKILQTIMTAPTVGLHSNVRGATASSVVVSKGVLLITTARSLLGELLPKNSNRTGQIAAIVNLSKQFDTKKYTFAPLYLEDQSNKTYKSEAKSQLEKPQKCL